MRSMESITTDQYNFYLLGYRKEQYVLEKPFVDKLNIVLKVCNKLSGGINKIIGKIRYGKYLKR